MTTAETSETVTAEISQTVKINRAVKERLDAADRELMIINLVKSSEELWAGVRLAVVLTLKQCNLPHETDDEIFTSLETLDKQENAKRRILESYQAVRIFHDNASHDFLELEEFLFCRPSATEFVDRMQELCEKLQ